MTELLIALLSVALGAFALYYVFDLVERRRARAGEGGRTRAMAEAAARLGLAFEPEARDLGDAPFLPFPLCRIGHARRCEHEMRGKVEGYDVQAFDYAYLPGDSSGVFRQDPVRLTAVAIPISVRLPDFVLSPEAFGDRLREALGQRDLDFEDDPAFSRAYFLAGKDEEGVRAVFTPRLRARLAADPGWSLEGGGYWLLAYRGDRRDARVPPEAMDGFLRGAVHLARLIEHRA